MGDASTLECGALKDFGEMIAGAWRRALKAVRRRGWSAAGMDPEIISDPAVVSLVEATAGVLDSAIGKVPMSEAMRRNLERSNFIFSGFKTYHSLNEAFPSMVDANGELKPFDKFLNDVQSIEKRYNSNYLRAEYNFAVASAQSASQWEQIAADGDRFDLQYRTAGDSKVRPTHAALNGVTLPPSSPFWDSFMPPNGWNCRCTAVQVRRGKYPNIDVAEALALGEEATADDKRGMLRFNPGKLGKTFPDYNPYTISRCRDCDVAKGKSTFAKGEVPESEQCAACQYILSCERLRSEVIKVGDGEIKISNLVNREDGDFSRLMQVARHFATSGSTVILTPKMTRPARYEYDCIYGSLRGTKYYGKCPDLSVDGKWYEHEGFVSKNPKNAFRNMMNDGLVQSSRLVIDKPDLTEPFMLRGIIGRVARGEDIIEVWLRDSDGSMKLLYKKADG
jgi:SPP1 gp7 family putative phage head morphogenesis protein